MSERLAIVGDGLIGRSVRLAYTRRVPGAEVASFDRGDDLAGLAEATTVVLAAPVDVLLDLVPRLATLAPAAALITDTGSTKHAIAAAARQAGLTRFVPGHPMAGGTRSGPAGARADLFDGRPWFLVTGSADTAAVARARALVSRLGGVPIEMTDDGEAHDRLVAAISHLPQLVATTLLARVGETVGADGLRHGGAGLRDTTRLAASQASMWAPILDTNAAALAPLLRALARDLEATADGLTDRAHVDALFARAHRFTFDP
ncbi:MAG: prephenate dehydrogenase/arogenate dehydrogenase family protein [Acidobacteria bacterium]|nr:prephenate dehydrogenase/arogenate dehydrogenase family protein [Acidobacteriota bacterium]